MKSKYSIFFLAIMNLIFVQLCNSQSKAKDRCYTDIKMQTLYEDNPGYYESVQAGFKSFAGNAQNIKSTVVTIPVHVIIVHPSGQPIGSGDNLSLDHIQSQIDVINEDFRRNNADSANMPPEFPGDDSEVEFCMASTDPNGNSTDGVTRYVFSGNFDDNEFMIKNATKWPREDYLNIWVAGNIGGLLGYAYIPSTTNLPNPTLDGVVCWTPAFGGPGYATHSIYNLGRTVTHEVGHYLGLNHVWGGGNGGCGQDDGISDTPVQEDKYFGCPNHPSPTCGSNDMFMNYMDYVDDACMNSFTTLQGNYMQLILNTSRSSLLNAANTLCTLAPPLSGVILDQSDLDCNGDFSGWIEAEAIGGTGPYTYSLNNGSPQSSGLFTDLAAGSYDIEIQDANGNTFVVSTVLSEPDPLILSNDLVQNVSCSGGSDGFILLSASGGTMDYLYKLNNGNYQASGYFPNLAAGNYIAYVQDANQCVKLLVIQVSQPEDLIVFLTDQTDVDCFGNNTGTITVNGFGGNGNYMYSLNGAPFGTQTTFVDLEAGDYIVSIIDSKNCSSSVSVSVDEPNELELTINQLTNPSCGGNSDGTVSLQGNGGVAPYLYNIDNSNYQGSNQFSNLSAGIYTFHIKDDHDCITSLEVALVDEGDISQSTSILQGIMCPGEQNAIIQVQASGGIPFYSYSIDGINFQTDSVFENLGAGNYNVYVEDQTGCGSVEEIVIPEPSGFEVILAEVVNEDCSAMNGSIQIEISGGSGDIDYSLDGQVFQEDGDFLNLQSGLYTIYSLDENNCIWNFDLEVGEQSELQGNLIEQEDILCAGTSSGILICSTSNAIGNVQYSLDNINFQSSGIFEELSAGIYTVYFIDDAGCQDQIMAVILENDMITVEMTGFTGADCGLENGSASFSAGGGESPYSYSINGLDFFNEGEFDGIAAGFHTLYIKDANDCLNTFNFEIEQLSSLAIQTVIKQDPLCFGYQNGSMLINASGGSGALQYSIDGVNFSGSNTFEGLGSGTFILTVMDQNGCLDEQMVILEAPELLELSAQNDLIYDCNGSLTGSVSFSISGGTGPYNPKIEGQNTVSPIPASFFTESGSYFLSVEDKNGCLAEEIEILIPEYIELQIQIIQLVPESSGGEDGSALIGGIGGNAPYLYSQDGVTFSTDSLFGMLSEGIYSFYVQDASGCIDEIEVSIGSTSTLDIEEKIPFIVYPNPVHEKIYIEFSENSDPTAIQFGLFSLDGRKIRSNADFLGGKFVIEVPENNNGGLYLLKLSFQGVDYWTRVIIL